jgi:hypothetical protein
VQNNIRGCKMDIIKEIPIELRNQLSLPPDVFLYVKPLTGIHAKTSKTKRLAVFKNDEIGRLWEKRSDSLKTMVGYWATWEEMLEIAKSQTGGKFEFFRDYN